MNQESIIEGENSKSEFNIFIQEEQEGIDGKKYAGCNQNVIDLNKVDLDAAIHLML